MNNYTSVLIEKFKRMTSSFVEKEKLIGMSFIRLLDKKGLIEKWIFKSKNDLSIINSKNNLDEFNWEFIDELLSIVLWSKHKEKRVYDIKYYKEGIVLILNEEIGKESIILINQKKYESKFGEFEFDDMTRNLGFLDSDELLKNKIKNLESENSKLKLKVENLESEKIRKSEAQKKAYEKKIEEEKRKVQEDADRKEYVDYLKKSNSNSKKFSKYIHIKNFNSFKEKVENEKNNFIKYSENKSSKSEEYLKKLAETRILELEGIDFSINGDILKVKIGSIVTYEKLKNLKAHFLGFKDNDFTQIRLKSREGKVFFVNIDKIIDVKPDPLFSNWNFEDDIFKSVK